MDERFDRPVVTLGLRGVPHFAREAMRAIYGHVVERRASSLSRAEVTAYFESRSATDDSFDDLTDSSSWTYQRLLECAPVRAVLATSDPDAGVVDYGCGRGALRGVIKALSSNHLYVGYDIDRFAISRHAGAGGRAAFTTTLPVLQFGVAFLVNVLVYTSDVELDAVLDEVMSLLAPDGALIVVEPWPAWYWETCFAGLRLRMREREKVDAALAQRGRHLVDRATLALFGWRGHAIAPIAWLGVWRPS